MPRVEIDTEGLAKILIDQVLRDMDEVASAVTAGGGKY